MFRVQREDLNTFQIPNIKIGFDIPTIRYSFCNIYQSLVRRISTWRLS